MFKQFEYHDEGDMVYRMLSSVKTYSQEAKEDVFTLAGLQKYLDHLKFDRDPLSDSNVNFFFNQIPQEGRKYAT